MLSVKMLCEKMIVTPERQFELMKNNFSMGDFFRIERNNHSLEFIHPIPDKDVQYLSSWNFLPKAILDELYDVDRLCRWGDVTITVNSDGNKEDILNSSSAGFCILNGVVNISVMSVILNVFFKNYSPESALIIRYDPYNDVHMLKCEITLKIKLGKTMFKYFKDAVKTVSISYLVCDSMIETEDIQENEVAQETEDIQENEVTQENEDIQDNEVTQETEDIQDNEVTQETEDIQENEVTQETEDIQENEVTQETEDIQDNEVAQETEDIQNADENSDEDLNFKITEFYQFAKDSTSYEEFVYKVCNWIGYKKYDVFYEISKLGANKENLNWKTILRDTGANTNDRVQIPNLIIKKCKEAGYGKVRLKKFFLELIKYGNFHYDRVYDCEIIWVADLLKSLDPNLSDNLKVRKLMLDIGKYNKHFVGATKECIVGLVIDAVTGDDDNFSMFDSNIGFSENRQLMITITDMIINEYNKKFGDSENLNHIPIKMFLRVLKDELSN